MADGPRFRGIMVYEGVDTSDGRIIGANETTWRDLPLSLMVMTKSSHGGMPTTETAVGGYIDLIERQPAAAGTVIGEGETAAFQVYYEGNLDTGEVATEAARLIGNGSLRGVSIDFAAVEEVEVTAEDEDGWPTEFRVHYTQVEIMAATVCPTPAFAGCYIELVDGAPAEGGVPAEEAAAAVAHRPTELVDLVASAALPALRPTACEPCGTTRAGLTASGGIPTDPPAAWFDQPTYSGPQALRIEDGGRVHGHLALWSECHIGISGQCVTPPRNTTGYSRFRAAEVRTAEGSRVATGPLTMSTTHPATQGGMSVDAVQAHYANTGEATADVAVYEDAWGIVVAGAARPNLTPAQLREARGSVLSGDWREAVRGSGRLELVAALHVNAGGFGVPRADLVADAGRPVALVAAGATASQVIARRQRAAESTRDTADLERRLAARIDKALAPLTAPLVEERRRKARDLLAAGAAPPIAAKAKPRLPKGDAAFLRDMVAHHGDGIGMAHDYLAGSSPDVRQKNVADLAQSIVDTQTAEVAQMTDWLHAAGEPVTGKGAPMHGGSARSAAHRPIRRAPQSA